MTSWHEHDMTHVWGDESEPVFEVARVVHVDILGQILGHVHWLLFEPRRAGRPFPD